MQQASRISDKTAFFLGGDLIEFNTTKKCFSVQFIKKQRITLQENLARKMDDTFVGSANYEDY